MELEHGIVLGDKFKDDETGKVFQIGNIMIAKSGHITLAFREGEDGKIQHKELYDFIKGKTHTKLTKD